MRRLLVAGALVAGAVTYAAPASAIVCPRGTHPVTLPSGHTVCVPTTHCDPVACKPFDSIHCPTDIPVWTHLCTQIFGWD